MEYQFWQLGHILRKFHEDPLSLLVPERNIYYSKATKEGKQVKYDYEPKRIIRFNICTETMDYTFDATEEMTVHTLEEIKYVGNGLGRTSKKCAPYFWANKFWDAPFFDKRFYSDVLHWRDKSNVTLYEEEIMKKIDSISQSFPFENLNVLDSLQSFGITDKDSDKIGIVLLEIDGKPLHEDEVFQEAIIHLISNFQDVNESQEYTCAITNKQTVPLSNDTGKTVMKFFTQTDPYHFQFQASLKKDAINNFLLSKDAQLEYMIGSKFVENYLSIYPLIRNTEGVDAGYIIPSFEEPLNEEEEEIVYNILMNHMDDYRNSKGSRGFDLEKLIDWQQTFQEVLEDKTITFEILFISTPSGAYKVVNHFSKVDFGNIRKFRITFNEEIDRLRDFNYFTKEIRKPKLEDILDLKATTHTFFINQLLEIALYGDRKIRESAFVLNSIQIIDTITNNFRVELTKKKEKDIPIRVLLRQDRLIFMFDALHRTLHRLQLFTGGTYMDNTNESVLSLIGESSIFNKKYDDYADLNQFNSTQRALLYLGGVIRNVFNIEVKKDINPTKFNVQSLNAFNLEQLINQLYLRLDLFEREEYEGYYPSIRKLLDNANLLLGDIKTTIQGYTPYQISRFIYLGSAIANLFVEIPKNEEEPTVITVE